LINAPYLPQRNLAEMPFRIAKIRPKDPAVYFQKEEIWKTRTWQDFCSDIKKCAAKLQKLGFKKGNYAIIRGDSCYEWLVLDMATYLLQLVNVPVSIDISKNSLDEIRLITQEDKVLTVDKKHQHAGEINLSDYTSYAEEIHKIDETKIFSSTQPDEIATVMFTSGSTGTPKGVVRKQASIIFNIKNFHSIGEVYKDDIYYLLLSLNHITGRQGWYRYMACGMAIAIPNLLDLNFDINSMQALKPTHTTLVPRCLEKIVNKHLSEAKHTHLNIKDFFGGKLRYFSYGGSRTPQRILDRLNDGSVAMVNGYGSTEASVVSIQVPGDACDGSCGNPLKDYFLKISDAGELFIKSEGLFSGYLTNNGFDSSKIDQDGFFHTGDIAEFDALGHLRVKGRLDGSFAGNDGNRIFPSYIEQLLEAKEEIEEAIIFGAELPFVSAIIYPRTTKTLQEVQSAVNQTNQILENSEKIKKFYLLTEHIPDDIRTKLRSGKIKIHRPNAQAHYQKIINNFYNSQGK